MKKQKIIVGIDYTKSSINALKYAQLLAYHSNSEIILFHLYDVPVLYTNSGLYFISNKSLQKSDAEKLKLFAKKHLANDGSYTIHTASGSFKQEVEDLIKLGRVQAIVLGLESKSKMNRFIFGSTTTDVAGKVDCPVIIVPQTYVNHSIGKTIIVVDNKEMPSAKCLKKIKNFINATQNKVEVYHIKTPNELVESGEENFNIDKALSYKIITKKSNTLIDGILNVANQTKAQAIIEIARKHSFIYRFFNESHTKEIAFSSKVPVIVVHE